LRAIIELPTRKAVFLADEGDETEYLRMIVNRIGDMESRILRTPVDLGPANIVNGEDASAPFLRPSSEIPPQSGS